MIQNVTEKGWLELGSIAGVVTAVSTTAMAIAVVITAIYAKRTLQSAKNDSRARTRPMLVAFLERELLAPGTILLVIKNFGPSAATDVHVIFDPPAPTGAELEAMPNTEHFKWLYQRFAEPVPVWAPGWTTSNVVRAGDQSLQPFAVRLCYLGSDGTNYDEAFALQPDHILKATSSGPSETDDPIKLGRQVVSALHALVRTVRAG